MTVDSYDEPLDQDETDTGTLDDLDPAPTPATPYAAAAHRYLRAGWRGVLALPPASKAPPPDGYTGETGAWTSGADVQAWIDGGIGHGRLAGNLALRLPPDVIGLDVDAYAGKTGAATIAVHLARLGSLPDTWTSSSRSAGGDHASGIRLYRLPAGVTSAGWPSVLGPGVELIRTGHRYMVVAPSVHPDGPTYRWTRPDGTPTLEVPTPGELPVLPPAWAEHLSEQARASPDKADLGLQEASAWLTARQAHAQPHQGPCRLVDGYLRHKADALTGADGGSRHEAMLQATARLAHAAAEGHRGILQALDVVHAAFTAAAGDGGHRDTEGEWRRAVLGAVQIAAHEHGDDLTLTDPCDVREDPLAGLVPPTATSHQEQPCPLPSTPAPNTTMPAPSTSTATTGPATSAGTAPGAATPSPSQPLDESETPSPEAQPDPEAVAAARAAFHAYSVGQEVDKLRIRHDAARAWAAEQRAAQAPAPIDAGTLADILARPPEPPMRAEGLVPWEASVLLVAKRKSGKTTMLLNYARSLLTGDPFLGRFPVIPVDGRVALVNYEVSGAQIARWADEHGLDRDRLFIVNLRGRRNPLGDPTDQAELAALIRAKGCETVIVDPFGRAYTGQSQNDAGEVGQWLVNLDYFARAECGAKDLLLAVHAGWNGDRTRGSSALEDWADTIITLTRDEEDEGSPAYVKATGRDVDVDEDALDFDHATRTLTLTGHGGRSKAKTVRRASALARELVDLVAQHPGSGVASLERLCKDAGVTVSERGDVGRALTMLASSGQLRCEDLGAGKAKRYHLKTETPPTPPNPPARGGSTTPPTPSIGRGGAYGGVGDDDTLGGLIASERGHADTRTGELVTDTQASDR